MSEKQRRKDIDDFSESIAKMSEDIRAGKRPEFTIPELQEHIKKFESLWGDDFEKMKKMVCLTSTFPQAPSMQLHCIRQSFLGFVLLLQKSFDKGDLYKCERICYMLICMFNRHMTAICVPSWTRD